MATIESEADEVQRPIHSVEFWPTRVAIWRNQNDAGDVWYTVTVSRRYKVVKKGKKPTYATTYGLNAEDVLPAALALQQAYAWIRNRMREDHAAANRNDSAEGEHDSGDGF